MFDDADVVEGAKMKNRLVAASIFERDKMNHDALMSVLDEARNMTMFDIVSAYEMLPDVVKHAKSHTNFQQSVMKSVAEIVHLKLMCFAKPPQVGGGDDGCFRIWFAIFRDLAHVSAFCNRDGRADRSLDDVIIEMMKSGKTGDMANQMRAKRTKEPATAQALPDFIDVHDVMRRADDVPPYAHILLRIAREFCDDNALNEAEMSTQHMMTFVYVVSDHRAMLCITPSGFAA
jgi:hypothetical protein